MTTECSAHRPIRSASCHWQRAPQSSRVVWRRVEAFWDGDTVHDWFVLLVAVLDSPDGESHLATVYRRPDGSPPGVAAADAGRTLADHLGVPFHFASLDSPGDEAPRWRPARR
nr:hypothetical protein StreXyl84_63340 [Streptomyces sp. Xyl84]